MLGDDQAAAIKVAATWYSIQSTQADMRNNDPGCMIRLEHAVISSTKENC